uniref:G-protein coupled receptor 4-like n=1 Tax=Semicossyphus pulcher TaxID=241346 RepID=UPI0037E859FF
MGDFHNNHTSQNESYNHNNISVNYEDDSRDYYLENAFFIRHVSTCIIIVIGLPLTLVAIYSLYSSVRNDHVAPIYVINLLISDLVQLCCLIAREASPGYWITMISLYVYDIAVLASVSFMLCLALERYLVIAHPLWYRFRRTVKTSVLVSLMVWALSTIYSFSYETFVITFLLPIPLLIFFLVGTLKALSASISVHSDEKRRIVAILVVVLLVYTLLFLPRIIVYLPKDLFSIPLLLLSDMFISVSPLADLVLYVFIRKGAIDNLLASVCCCRMESNDTETTISGERSRSFTATV